jgi:hypothetical protein
MDVAESQTTPPVLTPVAQGMFATVGSALGALTVVVLCEMYPPRPGLISLLLIPAVATVSLLVLLAVSIAIHRRVGELATQWFVVGYAAAMLVWGSLVLGEETIALVRDRIPSTLGVAGV